MSALSDLKSFEYGIDIFQQTRSGNLMFCLLMNTRFLNPWGQPWDPSDFRFGLAGTKFTDPSTGKRIRGLYNGVLADLEQ